MLFEYHGLNDNGFVVRGFIEATDQKAAVRAVKNSGKAEVLMDVKKTLDVPSFVKFKSKYIESLADSENKTRERNLKRELKKIEKKKKELQRKETTKTPEKSLLSRFRAGRKEIDSSALNLNEDAIRKLQDIFARQQPEKNNNAYTDENFDEKVIEYEKTLKLEEKFQNRLREKNGDKEIDWSLLMNETDVEVSKKGKKLKVKPKDLFLFTRRLQIMLSSGVSLLSALKTLQDSTTPALSIILKEIILMIQNGSSFSQALSRFPGQFDTNYVALISVGETSGSLDRCLLDIIAIQEQQLAIKKKLKSATVYPIGILVVLAIVLVLGSVFFIPSFEDIFVEQGMELPILTRTVFALAGIMPELIAFLILATMGFNHARKRIPSVDRFWKKHWHKVLLRFPMVKQVSIANYMFTFSSTVSLMLSNGIKLKDTLSLTYKAINNVYIKNAILSASGLMVRGEPLADALAKQREFDRILVNIVATGEESGRLSFSLDQVAKFYKDDLDKQISVLLELVPLVSMLLVGLLIGPVVIAIYLPILDMSSGALL